MNVVAAHAGKVEAKGTDAVLGSWIVLRGSAGATLYAPVAGSPAEGTSVAAGAVIGSTTAAGFVHFQYAPEGEVFSVAIAVDPVPCFVGGKQLQHQAIIVSYCGLHAFFSVKRMQLCTLGWHQEPF